MRILLIGYGWRALFFYRIIKALPDRFTLVKWVLRTQERAEEVRMRYQVETSWDVAEALSCPHDLVILSVPSSSMESLLLLLIKEGETVLCETGFTALSLESLNSLYCTYAASKSKVFVAEQYYRYPYYHSCRAIEPLLGPATEVRVASLHDHHGTSLIRHYLAEGGENCTISAVCRPSWVVKTGARDTVVSSGERIQTKRTVAVFAFADGRTGYFDFADVQYHSCIRSSHFSLFGERGEIVDNEVRYLNADNEGIVQTIQRIEDGGINNNPRSLRAVTFGETYHFRNPYWPLGFNDDEIAIALCMEDACHNQGYTLHEALQDSYLAQCMHRSCTEGRTIETESQVWTQAFSSSPRVFMDVR
ncbi:MAG: Gfo/Idh/MocA family oxidoreductase [Sphaerochaeta sp.]|nr:Gfo/Idh/MocA family oxidoreductase [Sphaerochaeta sp.]